MCPPESGPTVFDLLWDYEEQTAVDDAHGENADAATSPPSARRQQVEVEPEAPGEVEWIEPEAPTEAEPDGPDPEFEDFFDPLRHDGGWAIELGSISLKTILRIGVRWKFL